MYREIVVRVFGEEVIEKVDELRQMGIDFTDLVYSAIMAYEIENIKEKLEASIIS